MVACLLVLPPPENRMKRLLMIWFLVALPAVAWGQRLDDTELVVATVNGEAITKARLDEQWDALAEETRTQYEKVGEGKLAFLETVIRRRVLLQDAVKRGFDRWPEVSGKPEIEREAMLFDVYVREVVAPRVVSEEVIRDFYDANPEKFIMPERVKLRLIAISTARRMPVEAREIASRVSVELHSLRPQVARTGNFQILVDAFASAAARYSEHPSGAAGGDLGWVEPRKLEQTLGEAAMKVPEKMISGILETPAGYALMLVEKRNPATTVSYDAARDAIRQRLLQRSGREIVLAAADYAGQLRNGADVRLLPENLR